MLVIDAAHWDRLRRHQWGVSSVEKLNCRRAARMAAGTDEQHKDKGSVSQAWAAGVDRRRIT